MPGETVIQVAGSGYRIPAALLKEEFERTGQLRTHLQKYTVAHLVQTSQNAACNRLHTIGERLARWILTCHDRVQSNDIPLTHELLGVANHLMPRLLPAIEDGVLRFGGAGVSLWRADRISDPCRRNRSG